MEDPVGPDSKARYVLPPYPGLFHNMKIFKAHLDKHLACLVKEDADVKESDDLSVNNNEDKNMWAAILDKGYKGLNKYGRFLTPKKKPHVKILIWMIKKRTTGSKMIG